MVRVSNYRGKTAEELQKLSMEDYSKMVTSRQRRMLKRMCTSYKELIAKAELVKKRGTGKAIRTQVREALILPSWLGMKFAVSNGKEYKELLISPEMLGHRLGEFSFTTKRVIHSSPGIKATRGSKFLSVK